MRMPYELPAAGSLLRWGGLFVAVIAIVVGIVGMHGINGASATSLMSGGSAHAAIEADSMTVQLTPTSAHSAWEPGHPTSTASLVPQSPQPEAECPPAECTYTLAMRTDCIPNVYSPALHVPLPGTLTTEAAGASLALIPGHKASDRVPVTPSLEKLSISQT